MDYSKWEENKITDNEDGKNEGHVRQSLNWFKEQDKAIVKRQG